MTARQLAVAIALGCATAAHGQAVHVEIHPAQVETYDVHGGSIADVAAHIGSGHVALTRWRVTWKYTLEESGACRLKKMGVDVSSTIRMPRWVDRDAASPRARASWDAFYEAMRRHEEGHRDHGIRAGREIAREIGGFSSRDSCRGLKDGIEAMASRVIASYQAADIEYDRSTRHGIAQGAILR